jgi:hypothetical protein
MPETARDAMQSEVGARVESVQRLRCNRMGGE